MLLTLQGILAVLFSSIVYYADSEINEGVIFPVNIKYRDKNMKLFPKESNTTGLWRKYLGEETNEKNILKIYFTILALE